MPPDEDSGSRTLNRYRWQSRVAAKDLLLLLSMDLDDQLGGTDPPYRALVSEYHEDWMLIDGDRYEIVSAKHLDPDQGAWTWSMLMSDGGIPHLYRNYRRFEEKPRCRMVTNNAIRSSADTRSLRNLCQLDDDTDASPRASVSAEDRAELNHTLARYLLVHHKKSGLSDEETQGRAKDVNKCRPSSDLLEASARFLTSLTLETGLPNRRDIVDLGPSRFVEPVLKRLGHPTSHAKAVWEALSGYVEQSMENQLPTKDAGLTRPIRSFSARTAAPHGEATEKRTVTTGQALVVIKRALDRPGIYLAPPMRYEHKVSVKMDAGGLEANAIQRAEDRMVAWRKTCAAEVDDSPGNHPQIQEFSDALEDEVDDLHVALRTEGVDQAEFGMRLWHNATRIPPENFPPLPFRLTRKLLTGALADASDQCRIWFTPHRFDADRILLASHFDRSPDTDEAQEEGP